MDDNYRRRLTSWLRTVETEIAELRAAVQSPRDSALLRQQIRGSRSGALEAMDSVLREIDALARRLGLERGEEDLLWSAHTQLISAEISVGELLPQRTPGGPRLVGDEGEVELMNSLLQGLLRTIRMARENLVAGRGPGTDAA